MQTDFNNHRPFWFYLPVLLAGMLPWSLLSARAVRAGWRATPDGSRVRPLMCIAAGVTFGFFSLPASKMIGYVLAATPPAITPGLRRWGIGAAPFCLTVLLIELRLEHHSNRSQCRAVAALHAAGVRGVIGLSNTVRPHSHVLRPAKHSAPPSPDCETPYVTAAQLFYYYDKGVSYPYGYGGGPGCNGLTPSQTNSIYGAPSFGPMVRGAGVNLAVFELSAYQQSDILTWAHHFYWPGYTPPLVDITVDGGPLNPICPAGDTCPAQYNGYSGDIEVDADIETQLAVSPDARNILVYNAPNDFTGQTELDEYTRFADDNRADVISSSWGACENDAGAAYVQAEDLVFKQMPLKGRSCSVRRGIPTPSIASAATVRPSSMPTILLRNPG